MKRLAALLGAAFLLGAASPVAAATTKSGKPAPTSKVADRVRTSAQAKPPSRSAAQRKLDTNSAIAQAGQWALRLWNDALAFTGRASKRAGVALDKATKERDRERSAREKLEKELAEAQTLVNNFAQARTDLRKRESTAKRRLAEVRSDLALLVDADGSLQGAIDAGVMRKLAERMGLLAAKARKHQALRLLAQRDQLVAAAVQASARAAVVATGADGPGLEREATAVARELASSGLEKAARAFVKALKATGDKKAKRVEVASGDVRRAITRALPSVGEIAIALDRRLRARSQAAAAALLVATWPARRIPIAAARAPATAAALARHAGNHRAAVKALPTAPPDPDDIGKNLSLAPVQNAIKAAAAAAHRALEARRAAWGRALEGLAQVAQEVLE